MQARRARLISANKSTSVVELELTEGRNREVRRLLDAQNLTVRRLQRVRIGPIKLGELPAGRWRALTEPEIKSLLLGYYETESLDISALAPLTAVAVLAQDTNPAPPAAPPAAIAPTPAPAPRLKPPRGAEKKAPQSRTGLS